MNNVKVDFSGKKSFAIKVREHEVITDLPLEQGGDNAAPTPPELFVASIGSCMGIYALSYLKTAGMDSEGLSLSLDWDFDKSKKKIGSIKVTISAPKADLGERKAALISAAEKCLLHNTLYEAPEITTVLAE